MRSLATENIKKCFFFSIITHPLKQNFVAFLFYFLFFFFFGYRKCMWVAATVTAATAVDKLQ